jgi:rod shape-determining protein MreB
MLRQVLTQKLNQTLHGFNPAVFSELAIDLGTSNTVISIPGRGTVINEPSVIAVHNRDNQIIAVGREAKLSIGREPQSIRVVRPISQGVIADIDAARKMLSYYIRQALGSRRLLNPRVLLCVPAELTPVEQRAIELAAHQAGARSLDVVKAPIAAAAGSGCDIEGKQAVMIVDVGGGTTDIAVMSFGGPVYVSTVAVGGCQMDEAILRYIHHSRGLEIGETTAESLKLELGAALPRNEKKTIEVRGRGTSTGLPHTITVSNEEIHHAIEPAIQRVIDAVRCALEELPPEISGDLLDSGIVMSGGAAQLAGLTERLSREVGFKVRLAPDPLGAVALGASQMLGQPRERSQSTHQVFDQEAEELAA